MRRLEVAEYVGGELLDSVEEGPGRALHLGPVGDGLVGESALQIGVDEFIGAQVRRVSRQEMQLDPVGAGRDSVPHVLGAVCGVPVDHQVDLLIELAHLSD